jgi:hypothetical protein
MKAQVRRKLDLLRRFDNLIRQNGRMAGWSPMTSTAS